MKNLIKNKKIIILILAIILFLPLLLLGSLKKSEMPSEAPTETYDEVRTDDTDRSQFQSRPPLITEVPKPEERKVPPKVIEKVAETGKEFGSEGDLIVEEVNDYGIVYFAKDKAFLITIFESPFEEKKILAEEEFLKSLNITKDEACELTVIITTPKYANPAESGLNYRLSFCE